MFRKLEKVNKFQSEKILKAKKKIQMIHKFNIKNNILKKHKKPCIQFLDRIDTLITEIDSLKCKFYEFLKYLIQTKKLIS